MNLPNKLALVVVFSLSAALGPGRDIYVATNGPNTGDPLYGTWDDASSNIEWAVNVAAHSDNDIIWISNGVYIITNQIMITNNITISGVSADDRPVVDANDSNRCFFFARMTGVFENIFVTRGSMNNNHGGGGLVTSSWITIRNCIFSNNVITNSSATRYGGGLALYNSTTTVQRCAFIDNKIVDANNLFVGYGGGLGLIYDGYTTLVDHCTFYTNSASSGGGLYDRSTNTVITGCDFICNVATSSGGGAGILGPVTHSTFASNVAGKDGGGTYGGWLLTNCYFSNNIANETGGGARLGRAANCLFARNISYGLGAGSGGGGVYIYGAGWAKNCIFEENYSDTGGGGVSLRYAATVDAVLQNCLVRNNVSKGNGGGIWNLSYPAVIISSCTIVSNYGGTGSGGLYVKTFDGLTGVRIENSVIYFNKVGSGSSSNYKFDDTVIFSSFTNCCSSPEFPAGIINVNTITNDPEFIEPASGNYQLKRNSPCVNAGAFREWMTGAVDLDGRTRIRYGIVDIGVYELIYGGTVYMFR